VLLWSTAQLKVRKFKGGGHFFTDLPARQIGEYVPLIGSNILRQFIVFSRGNLVYKRGGNRGTAGVLHDYVTGIFLEHLGGTFF